MGRGWPDKFFIPKLPATSLCFQITILDDAILSVKGGSSREGDKLGGAGGVIQIIGSCGEIQRPGVILGNGGSTCSHEVYPENGILVIKGISQVNYTPAIADQLKHCLEVARLPAKPNPKEGTKWVTRELMAEATSQELSSHRTHWPDIDCFLRNGGGGAVLEACEQLQTGILLWNEGSKCLFSLSALVLPVVVFHIHRFQCNDQDKYNLQRKHYMGLLWNRYLLFWNAIFAVHRNPSPLPPIKSLQRESKSLPVTNA